MQLIQQFTGTLQHGFIGNIAYHIPLTKQYESLHIELSYDKLHFEKVTPNMKAAIINAYTLQHGHAPDDTSYEKIISGMKTEIQLAAFLGEDFLGNVHHPAPTKSLFISQQEASRGCYCHAQLVGTLKVIVNAFSVLEDHTTYTLTIKGAPYDTI